jgi:hypothetical protein
MRSLYAEVSTTYTVKQASWILGVTSSELAARIRRGHIRAICRRGRLAIPAFALTQLLDNASSVGGGMR